MLANPPVYNLLRSWGNPEHVCLAGLFHSIYGPALHRHQRPDRRIIAKLIGEKAETLCYILGVTDRPIVYFDSGTIITRFFWNYHTKKMMELDWQMRDQLVEIEAAVLLAAGNLSELRRERLLLTRISSAAKMALAACHAVTGQDMARQHKT